MKRNGHPLLLASLAALAVLGLQSAQPGSATAEPLPYFPGQLLVKFKENVPANTIAMALGGVSGQIKRSLAAPDEVERGKAGTLVVSTATPVPQAVAALSRNPAVEYAEPDWRLTISQASNDPYYTGGSLWGTYGDDLPSASGPSGTTNAFGSQAEKAWAKGQVGSSSVYVGVIDEGIQVTHPDLAGNIWTNPFDPVDGLDNDGNGYTDDVNGWDFLAEDASVYDGTGDDHGTHVAGTIGGVGGNSLGVAGVNWDVTLIPAKFLGASGGYTSDAVQALNYLRDLKLRHGLNLVASSNSWGGGGYSQTLHDAILRSAKAGILFVAAAGNSAVNTDATLNYPSCYSTLQGTSTESAANYEAVISVAAIDSAGRLASFSNYGATTVDLGAPGVGIVSTVPSNGYASYNGTSMATPHVAGALALYAAARPGSSAAEIRDGILSSVLPTASLSGKTVTGGRLNLGGDFGQPPAPVYDVAVTSVSAPASVSAGSSASVTVHVTNRGNQPATFLVSLTPSAGTASAPVSVSLAAGANASPSFTWSTVGAAPGNVTLTGTAAAVAGETNTADNTGQTTSSIVVSNRDVAVTALSAPSRITAGKATNISVTVANLGTVTESFGVQIAATAGAVSAAQSVTLAPGTSAALRFRWTPVGGTQVVSATAAAVPTETALGNNTQSLTVTVR